jgi:hypothetical protein
MAMSAIKSRVSFGDLQRELGASGKALGRAVLERLLRDWARELPETEIIGGSRTWPVEAVAAFRSVLQRDQERVR